MKFNTVLFLLILVWLFSGLSIAQDIDKRIDQFVTGEMARQKIPGVSIAVVKDGKPLIVKGYGVANIEHQVPVKPETIFQSGSIGKQFTAFAVMMLVDEGKIGLDEKISTYLGEVPTSWTSINVRHLLTHTGGMTDYPRDFDFRKDYTEDELFKRAKEIPTAFAPGEKWQYSNLGYVTLGIIIHKVSGRFYGDFLKERVFQPLGMTTARVISEADIVPNRAAGYELRGGQLKNHEWVSPSLNTTADGALYLSVLDMIKWEEGLANGKLLSRSAYDQMWAAVKLNSGKEHPYGFGWAVRSVNGRRLIEHGGAWQGFKSFIARYPDNKLTVIAFANLANMNPAPLAAGVAEVIDPTLIPKPIDDPDPKATAEFRQLLEGALNGNVDEKRFTPRIRQALLDGNDRLLAHLKSIRPIRKFELIARTDMGSGILYRYRVEFESMTIMLEMGVGADNLIGLFELQPG